MVQQREQILKLQSMQQEFQVLTSHPPKDTIKLDGIQKVHELEPEDKYKVLEYLVKEMMGMKDWREQEMERQRKELESERRHLKEQQRQLASQPQHARSTSKGGAERKMKIQIDQLDQSGKHND